MNNSKDYSSRIVKLNRKTLKVEIENYFSMIYGFKKKITDREKIKTSIFTSTNDAIALESGLRYYPQLLTLIQETRFSHRDMIFKQFKREYNGLYGDLPWNQLVNKIAYYHIAFIDTIYEIERDYDKQKKLWMELCSNGIFNQWKWCAPFNRYLKRYSKWTFDDNCRPRIRLTTLERFFLSDLMNDFTKSPLILLLRVYEINKGFSVDENIALGRIERKIGSGFDIIENEDDCHQVKIGKPVIQNGDFIDIINTLEDTILECEMELKAIDVEYTKCWED